MAISKLDSNASLRQVMDKFEEISLAIKNGDSVELDVECLSSLPSTVKNNKIVVISNYSANKAYIGDYYTSDVSKFNEKDVIITFIGPKSKLNISTEKVDVNVPLGVAFQKVNGSMKRCEGYIGINSKWVLFSSLELILYDNGAKPNALIYGDLKVTNGYPGGTGATSATTCVDKGSYIELNAGNGGSVGVSYPQCWGYDAKIQASKYSRLYVNFPNITFSRNGYSSNANITVGFNTNNTGTGTWLASKVITSELSNSQLIVDLDISNVTQDAYFCIYLNYVRNQTTFYVDKLTEIKLF